MSDTTMCLGMRMDSVESKIQLEELITKCIVMKQDIDELQRYDNISEANALSVRLLANVQRCIRIILSHKWCETLRAFNLKDNILTRLNNGEQEWLADNWRILTDDANIVMVRLAEMAGLELGAFIRSWELAKKSND